MPSGRRRLYKVSVDPTPNFTLMFMESVAKYGEKHETGRKMVMPGKKVEMITLFV